MFKLPNGDEIAVTSPAEASFQYRKMFAEDEYGKILDFPPECNVIDVGGNFGIFSKYAHHRQADCKVWAFEPIPQLFDCMVINADKVNDIVLRKAVGDGKGPKEVTMEYLPQYTMLSGLAAENNMSLYHGAAVGEKKAKVESAFSGAVTCTAPTTTLSDELKDIGIVHVMKIDIEGMEAAALAGIDEELWSRIQQIAIEVHDYDSRIKDMVEDLFSRGFVTTVTPPKPPSFVIGDKVGSWERGSGLGTSLIYGIRRKK